jgi:hypothetical protein
MVVRLETTNRQAGIEGCLVLAGSPGIQMVFGQASVRTELRDREATAAGSDPAHVGRLRDAAQMGAQARPETPSGVSRPRT